MGSRAAMVAWLLALGAGVARAQEFQATVSSEEIGLDETVQLNVTLTRDAAQPFQSYLRPDLSRDWDLLHQAQSESTQWTIVNNRQSVRTVETHVYLLRPRHKGPCTIPPASVRVGGRELKTRPIVVRVHAAAKRLPGAPEPTPDPRIQVLPEPEPMHGDEDLYLDARADKTSVYVGEQITVTWSLYTRADIIRYRAVADPKHDDFWSEDLFMPQGALSWTRQAVKGQEYQVAPLLKRALFPLKAGKLHVTPLEVEATTLQTAFYPTASAVRASRPVVIDVLPLPTAGRPAGFESANVGRFDLGATIDRAQVKAGDAVTWKLVVRGEGNLRNVKLKKVAQLDGFKVYEPTVSERIERGAALRGEKTFTYLLLPQKGGELKLPAVELPYFDPVEKKYAVARAPSLAVAVAGDPSKIGGGTTVATKENVLGARIRPLRNVHRVSSRIGERVIRGPLLWVALAAPPSLLLTFVIGSALRAVLVKETVRTRRRRARAAARRRLREAEVHLKGQRPSMFFGACARAIYEHLEVRLGVKCEALTVAEMRQLLTGRGLDETTAEAVVRELEVCDFARFAPSASGPGEMRAAIRRVRQLLATIDKAKIEEAA